jgi:hypothetical protein
VSSKPLILTDNLFDNVVLHPTFFTGNSGSDDAPGHETFRAGDNLRDLTSWTSVGTNAERILFVDCLAAVTPNTVIIDRGHNLKGVGIDFRGSTVGTEAGFLGSSSIIFSSIIPSSPGGLPTDANGCLTPDGVWWKTFTPGSFRAQGVRVPPMGVGLAPIITGLYIGTSYRFSEFLNAPGAYDYSTQVKFLRNELSRGGVRSKSRALNFDKVAFSLHQDSADYAGFEAEIRRMLRYNVPCWFAFDDSDTSTDAKGQMRMFQLPGDLLYDPQANPVHREIRGEFEEAIPTLYI